MAAGEATDPERSGQLSEILAAAARGRFPAPDGSVRVLPTPIPDQAAVVSFTAHALVVADVAQEWVDRQISNGDFSAPLNPPFLTALSGRLERVVNNVDMMLVATAAEGDPPLRLAQVVDRDEPVWRHPRVRAAALWRADVRVFTTPGAVLIIGRGLAGRIEMSYHVHPDQQGEGLGRALAASARYLVPAGEVVWAQCAPGNAASVRVLLAAGYVPVGAEAMLVPRPPDEHWMAVR